MLPTPGEREREVLHATAYLIINPFFEFWQTHKTTPGTDQKELLELNKPSTGIQLKFVGVV
jgi:hypothetical protein